MGNLLSCDKNEKNESIINLSDNCVGRITKQDKACAKKKPSKVEDDEWVAKLKCMDDVHSQQKGITFQCLLELIQKIEAEIQDLHTACSTNELIRCLTRNENCMIRCTKQIEEFIGCVDAQRINVIREKYETEKSQQAAEQKRLIKTVLKDGCN